MSAGTGPQIGFSFQCALGLSTSESLQGLAAADRPEGCTAWVTLAIKPAAPGAPPKMPHKSSSRKVRRPRP